MDGKGKAEAYTASLRTMMRQYEKQLLAARQLARFRAKSRMAAGLDIEEPEPGRNRGQKISQVVEELSLSLLISGNPFPVVEEIRRELSALLKKEIEFVYPPGKKLRLLVREKDGLRPLTAEEQQLADQALDKITRHQVDEGMFYNPLRQKTV